MLPQKQHYIIGYSQAGNVTHLQTYSASLGAVVYKVGIAFVGGGTGIPALEQTDIGADLSIAPRVTLNGMQILQADA